MIEQINQKNEGAREREDNNQRESPRTEEHRGMCWKEQMSETFKVGSHHFVLSGCHSRHAERFSGQRFQVFTRAPNRELCIPECPPRVRKPIPNHSKFPCRAPHSRATVGGRVGVTTIH